MAFDAMAFLQRELQKTSVPSRRQVKNKSGRSARKQANGQAALARVGGTRSTMRAIYAPADQALCVVVDSSRGWNADGTPNREPRW